VGLDGKENGALLNAAELVPQIPDCLLALESITPGQIVSIPPAHGGTHP
jgi:hypothetical protein